MCHVAGLHDKVLAFTMSEQTYDDGRARTLEQLLRTLADRIRELDAEGRLLSNPAELTRLVGDVKSELFHYEVRATYDTPEVAQSRRIVTDAIKQTEQGDSWHQERPRPWGCCRQDAYRPWLALIAAGELSPPWQARARVACWALRLA